MRRLVCPSCKHPAVSLALIRHRRCAIHVRRGRGNATKHFPNVRRVPGKSISSSVVSLQRCYWAHNNGHRRNLACEYWRPEQNRNSTSVSNQSWYGPPLDGDQTDAQSIDFPTLLFLDPGILQHGQVEISRTATSAPAYILDLLGDKDEIRAAASKFFEHIHRWMPFISRKRFYDLHLRSSFQTRPDVVLLLLSLKLITTLPPTDPRNPRTSLYHTLKHFYIEVEGSSTFSILVLQAGVLLALYEFGHAIYPAAFLSIGTCTRYAHALGISVSRTLHTRRVLTLVEVEERRRVWWTIVILDRFVFSPFYYKHIHMLLFPAMY